MASSPILVGRMLVDADLSDLASSLLSAQRALAGIEAAQQFKGKGRADSPMSDEALSDEAYAFKIQEEFVQDAFRIMEDFRLAKSLGAGIDTDYAPFSIVDKAAVDHLRVLLAMPVNADKAGSPLPESTTPDLRICDSPTMGDRLYNDSEPDDIDSIVDEASVSSHQAAAEHRQVLLAVSVRAGLPGPSDPAGRSEPIEFKESCYGVNDEDAKVGEPTEEQPPSDITEILGEQFGFPTVFCMICGDLVVGEPTLHAPCGHYLCVDCVQDLVSTSIRDESLYPPRCCQQPLPREAMAPMLTVRLQMDFDAKRLEFDTPASLRIFCPTPTCSAFIGSSEGAGETVACNRCKVSVCTSCKVHAHAGETCSENNAMSSVKNLAEANRWQTCPQCHAIVEKTMGCNHIVCRCSSNFCYGCGGRMGSCKC